MFWIQQTGNANNNSSYRLFYAETEGDIALMPTHENVGTQNNGDTVANQKCSLGSECLCLSSGDLYILSTTGWNAV